MSRRYDDDDDYEFDRPRKVSRGRKRGTKLAMPLTVLIPLAISGLLVLLSFCFPSAAKTFVWVCLGAAFVAQLWLLAIALSDSVLQLVLCLFVPFYSLFYLVTNFDRTKWSFGLSCLGLATMFGCFIAVGVRSVVSRPEPEVVERKKEDPKPPQLEPWQPPPKSEEPKINPPVPKKEEPKKDGPINPDPTGTRPFAVDPQAKAAGKTLYLAVLTPFAYQTGPWRLGIGEKGDDGKRPIVLQKKEYKYGISMHPPRTDACRVSFVPGKEFTRFKGSAGIGDGMNPFGTTVFAVYGDGRKLWESDGVNKSGAAGAFDINVTGVEVLTLETRIKDGSYTGAHAVWLDPWLER